MIEIQGHDETYSNGSVTTPVLKGISFLDKKTVLVDTQTPSNNEQ